MRMIDIVKNDQWLRDYEFFNDFAASPYFDKLIETYENLNTDILYDSKIHGQDHIERVIFFALVLSWKYGLDQRDTDILRYAACLHDTRRQNDGWDVDHGRRAASESIQYAYIDQDDIPILQAIMTAHSAPDEKIEDLVKEFAADDFDRALYLAKLFKDSDGLDRVRINRLDPSYLRNDFSRELVDFSYKLFENY